MAAQAQSASSSGSPRKKFFEDLTEKKDGGMMRSYPNIRLNETVSDFDRRVLKLRVSIAEARDLLSKSTPNLAVRSSMPIDPTSLSLGPAAGPLPPPGAFQVDLKEKTGNRSIGTSTDPCLVIPYPAFSALQLPPAWIKFLSPSPTFPHAKPGTDKAKEREEWSERVGRAQDYYRRTPSAPSPLTFSKVLQSELDLDTSDSSNDNDFSDDGEGVDGDDEDEATCCGDGEKFEVVSWTSSLSLGRAESDSPLTAYSSTSTLGLGTAPNAPLLLTFPSFKTRSMLNLGLGERLPAHPHPLTNATTHNEDRARSMEILLQDSQGSTKQAHLRAPENALMLKQQENRQMSEHELRIQKSLTKLDVPDWYRKYGGGPSGNGASPATPGRREFGRSGLAGGWSGLSSSKTSSLTSLQSTGRYSGGSRLTSSRLLATGTSSAGGRCGESLTSPNSTASVSPTPYYERSSFTYGMPYAMSRFGTARMSCGASPASLSPSPSPVAGIGSATSTPTASGPSTRHHSFSKQPYLGWRSQERLAMTSKSMYRTPSERLAADLLKTQVPKSGGGQSVTNSEKSSLANLEISPRKETASDLSLNNSEESNSHKLNRVRSSIKEVSNAIVDYVNESRPLDEGINGRASPRRGLVWLESSFVGTKPIDSPTTPDTPNLLMPRKQMEVKKSVGRSGDEPKSSHSAHPPPSSSSSPNGTSPPQSQQHHPAQTQQHQSMFSRNEQMEERYSNSSSVSSPTLDDILDSLLALRRPQKKFRARDKGVAHPLPTTSVSQSAAPVSSGTSRPSGVTGPTGSPARVIAKIESSFLTNPSVSASVGIGMGLVSQHPTRTTPSPSPVSDWQMRMNQPLEDSAEFLFPSSPGDPFGGRTEAEPPHDGPEESLLDDLLSIPHDPTRAFNISPETNVGHLAEPFEEERDGFKSDYFPSSVPSCGGPGPIKSHLMGGTQLGDSSLPSSPAKQRRVSFDLDLDEREEKSSSRSRKDSDSVGGSVIQCRNGKCGKSGVGLEARREFKTCHNCNAYYCSRECRRAHWEKHKKVCMQSRVGALCKQIIAQVREDPEIVTHLSRLSRQGYLAKGRGCMKLFFSSPDRAERFLTGGFPDLPEPWYIASGDILPEEMGAQVYAELSEQCGTYNTENRFVLYVSLCVVNEVPTSGAVKWEREMIARSAKIRLLLPRAVEEESPHHQVAAHLHHVAEDVYFLDPVPPSSDEFLQLDPTSQGETIILRSVPIPSRQLSQSEEKRMREVSFANIQRHLNERGVELRRTYPDIYTRLRAYVEKDEPFLPVTIYPRNNLTGKIFTCIIMPESSESPPSPLSGQGLNGSGTNRIIDISTPPNINATPNMNSS